ncbi:hypothetical protein QBC38DRAFT_93312 [Podospora fimiseda]|uniref:BZIP domain-containing protein n=1 Tax=Podospora fimiseda TaxID=252190 RepID=A0AAN7BZ74_9PEZI|nr:hypothetical protein QBC38DRAFT_93312 [Podospora fimiseda]
MDFNTAYFSTQPYPFIPMAPLTPSHSTSVASDDFGTTSPPEVVYDQFANGLSHEQFQNFENFVQFGSAAPNFTGPPTPPGAIPVTHAPHAPAHSAPGIQPGPISVNNVAVNGNGAGPVADIVPMTQVIELDENRKQGSNSEDEDLTPAQSRRKAQNRAAQRAFRERKERHVKDLETRLQRMEAMQHETIAENEQLRSDVRKLSTENEILRATQVVMPVSSPLNHGSPITTGPMTYTPAATEFFNNVLQNHTNKDRSHRILTGLDGTRLLTAGATWDLILTHPLYLRGQVDVGAVSERIKPLAKCDGQGPVFEERAIIQAIKECVASGTDELM